MAFELKIILSEDGVVSLTGPIDQKHLCYGMLELAREAILLHHMNKQIVKPATISDLRGVQ